MKIFAIAVSLLIALVGIAMALVFKQDRDEALASRDGLDALEAKQREHEQRLVALQREIADAELRADTARRSASLAMCHSDAERIDAAVSVKSANCMRELAQAEGCKANNERNKGESMRNGCALGLLAAAFTGGGSLLLAGGCLAGEVNGEAERAACPEPSCLAARDQWMPAAAREIAREGLPICELGIEVLDFQSTHDGGVLVHKAKDGAARAGIRSGDVIVRVGRARIRSREGLEAALGTNAAVEVEFIRGGLVRSVRVRTSDAGGRRVLGVELTAIEAVPYLEMRVARVEGNGTSIVAGLARNDVIFGLGTSGPLRATELSRATRKGGLRTLHVVRKGKRLTLDITTAPPSRESPTQR